jgi:DNA (cytosine-5)-methyltransferase 1
MQNDTRNYLYRYYLGIIKSFKPAIFVFENVPGMKSAKGGDIFNNFKTEARDCGYVVEDKLLDAQNFFVLQKRERLIIIGWRSEYDLMYPLFAPKEHDYAVSSLLEDLTPLVREKVVRGLKTTDALHLTTTNKPKLVRRNCPHSAQLSKPQR